MTPSPPFVLALFRPSLTSAVVVSKPAVPGEIPSLKGNVSPSRNQKKVAKAGLAWMKPIRMLSQYAPSTWPHAVAPKRPQRVWFSRPIWTESAWEMSVNGSRSAGLELRTWHVGAPKSLIEPAVVIDDH